MLTRVKIWTGYAVTVTPRPSISFAHMTRRQTNKKGHLKMPFGSRSEIDFRNGIFRQILITLIHNGFDVISNGIT